MADVIVIAKPAPGYRIVRRLREDGTLADGYELYYQEPAMLSWQWAFDGPTVAHCRKAHEQIEEGFAPQYWEDMDVAE